MFPRPKGIADGTGHSSGLTLVEVLVAIAIFSLIVTLLFQVTSGAMATWQNHTDREDLVTEGQWALNEMVRQIHGTDWVLLPLKENVTQDILAISDQILDTNGDRIPDSDDDRDGLFHEDYGPGGDVTGDGVAGIIGIDDNRDGLVDNGGKINDEDEDGATDEDKIDGIDNDNDGAIDEDLPSDGADSDKDGRKEEDSVDPVVFYLDTINHQLMERQPDYTTTALTDYVNQPIANHVTALEVTRITGLHGVLLKIRLTMESRSGNPVVLETFVLSRK